jgi:drug/metabolite transporter (DMT)-like permease
MNHSLVYIAIRSAIASLTPHFQKELLKEFSVFEIIFLLNLFILFISVPTYIWKGHSLQNSIHKIINYEAKYIFLYFIVSAISGIYLGTYLLKNEQVVVLKPLQYGMNTIFIILYGYLFFRKDNVISYQRIIGTIMVLIGIYLIYK